MGTRGPKRTPTNILKLRGSRRGDRSPDQPQLPVGAPAKPKNLRPIASKKWDELVPILLEQRTLSKADADKLQMYCQCWARYIECEEWVATHGMAYVIRDKKGTPMSSRAWPQARELDRLVNTLGRLGNEFGLSPSSRTGIQAASPPGQDEFDKFLNAS